VLAPAKSLDAMRHIVVNDYINASLCVLFMLVVVSTVFYAVKSILKALGNQSPTVRETPFEPMPQGAGG